ncbi:MAG TPA: metal ABC transporter substrate-binding protein [Solirubrobacteraceae bacterium]|nr:metal ABC transporter substrate-binding protein [Solirubrobacteraceae bacterium]
MRTILIALGAALVLAACGGDSGGGGAVRVVASTPQLADFARQVGGSRVEVDALVDGRTDPHDYEPRPSDARALAEADVVLRSGGEIDDWLRDVVETAGGDAETVVVGERIGARGDDPHWWQDPSMTLRAVDAIRDAFAKADAGGAAGYRRRAAAYAREVRGLDRAIDACMGSIPRERRTLVTNHDSFGWFARRYGIRVLGSILPGRSTAARPSARDVRELVSAIRSERVAAVFPESALDQRLERAVAREAGVEVGEPLYADTLGPEGTYVAALRHDADAMARAFGGDCDL